MARLKPTPSPSDAKAGDAPASRKPSGRQPRKVTSTEIAAPKARRPPSGFIRLPAFNSKPRNKAKSSKLAVPNVGTTAANPIELLEQEGAGASAANPIELLEQEGASTSLANSIKLLEQEDERRTERRQNCDPMPWMGRRGGYDNPNLFLCLHDEILDFVVFMSPTQRELELRHALVRAMSALVATLWPKATLETFGSHDTQMFLPNSDIDMVVFGTPSDTSVLHQLATKLRNSRMANSVEVIDKARIPIVKFVHKTSNLHVDVSFNVSGGLQTAALVKGYMRAFPFFRPLTLVLKHFLAQRGLNETYTGGVGSFLIQLMVVSFLQHRRRALGAKYALPQHNNLGQLLVGFFTLYGRDFNYNDVGISVRDGSSYFLKTTRGWSGWNLISVENPNEPTIDVGRNSFNFSLVRRAFDFARQVLTNEIHRRGQFDPLPGSILGTIIPPDSDLTDRTPPSEFGFDVLRAETVVTTATPEK